MSLAPRWLAALATAAALATVAPSTLADAPSPDPEALPDPPRVDAPGMGPGWAFGLPAAEAALAGASVASLALFALPQRTGSWGAAASMSYDPTLSRISDVTGSYVGTGLAMLGGLGLEFAHLRRQGASAPLVQALRATLVEAEAVAMTGGLTLGLKALTGRCRPRAFDGSSCVGREYDAFPSGHTSVISAVAGVRLVHALRTPARPGLRLLSFGLAEAASLATGALRVASGAHSWDDVVAGWALGHGIGALMALAHPWTSSSSTTVPVPIREIPGAARPTELPTAVPTGPTVGGSWTVHF